MSSVYVWGLSSESLRADALFGVRLCIDSSHVLFKRRSLQTC